jgi:hypothetical protein
VLATAGEVIEQLFGAFISWHTCTLKSRRRIASPEIRTKRMSIFKLQHGMAGHKMVLRRSNMRKRMSALGGGFNRSTQHLLILLEEEVCDGGDCTDMVHAAAEG